MPQFFRPIRLVATGALACIVVLSPACTRSTYLSASPGDDSDETAFDDSGTTQSDTTPARNESDSSEDTACDGTDEFDARLEMHAAAESAAPCFCGTLSRESEETPWTGTYYADIAIPASFSVTPCREIALPEITLSWADEAAAAIQDLEIPCSEGVLSLRMNPAAVDEQIQEITNAVDDGCELSPVGTVITLDEAGRLSDVVSADSNNLVDDASILCVQQGLEGLSFPCLAGMSLCPETRLVP